MITSSELDRMGMERLPDETAYKERLWRLLEAPYHQRFATLMQYATLDLQRLGFGLPVVEVEIGDTPMFWWWDDERESIRVGAENPLSNVRVRFELSGHAELLVDMNPALFEEIKERYFLGGTFLRLFDWTELPLYPMLEFYGLTCREHEVFRMIYRREFSAAQVAGRLGVTEDTVRSHVKHIRSKLQAEPHEQLMGRVRMILNVRTR